MFGRATTQNPRMVPAYSLFLPDKVTPFPSQSASEPLDRVRRSTILKCLFGMKKRRRDLERITVVPCETLVASVGGVIVCRDITQIKEEEFFALDKAGAGNIAADAPCGCAHQSCSLMEGQAEGLRCSILLLNRMETVRHARAESPRSLCESGGRAAIGPRNGPAHCHVHAPPVVTDVMTIRSADIVSLSDLWIACLLVDSDSFPARRMLGCLPCIARKRADRA